MKRLVALLPVLIAFQAGAPPALAWTWPVEGPVLRPFVLGNDPYAGGQHRGVDIAGSGGAPVGSPAAGVVSFAGTVPGGGRTVTVQTADGYSVTLVHLGSIAVGRDTRLPEGAPVGTIGPSGDREHSVPYVHLGIRATSDAHGYLDPLSFLPTPETPPPVVPAPPVEPAPAVPPAPTPDTPAPLPPRTSPVPAPEAPEPAPPSPISAPAPAPPPQVPAPTPASAEEVPERHSRPRAAVGATAPGTAGNGLTSPTRVASTPREGRDHEGRHRAALPQVGPAALAPGQESMPRAARSEVHAGPAASVPASGPHLDVMTLAASALVFGLAAATALRAARRRKLSNAVATNAPPAVFEDGARRSAEDAFVLGPTQEDRLILDGDLERVTLGEPEALPDLDRNDDSAQLVQMANDACRRRSAVISPARLHRVAPRLSSRCSGAKAVSAR
jgi:outer membrane biosynthesis protein TonB